jgi:exopolysaccharide production protein ExoZ
MGQGMDQPQAATPGAHLESLQYLRGLAAMLVVFYHAVGQLVIPTGSFHVPQIGAAGVDIFFVVSGFVMFWTTRGRTLAPGDFMLKRLIRIAPLYWFFTLAVAAVAFAVPQLLRATHFNTWHILMSLLFVPVWHPFIPREVEGAISPIIVPGWTLNLEIVFYLLFALTLKARASLRPWLLSILLIALYVAARTVLWPTSLRFYGTDLLAEFMAGVVLACLIDRLPRGGSRGWAALFAVALPVMLALDYARPPLPQSIFLGVPALLCVLAALQVERAGALPSSRVLGLLGDASYSIYLSHIFVIAGVRIVANAVGYDLALFAGVPFLVLTLATAATVGFAVHGLIEKPLLAAVNRAVRGNRRPPAAAEFAGR